MRLTERIQSRKFLLALSACIFFGFMGALDNLAQVVIAYLAVQAAQDALNDWQGQRTSNGSPETAAPTSDGSEYEEASAWTGSVT